MKIIGITGYIGSGKTTVASILAKNGGIVFNADMCVNNLYKNNKNLIKAIGYKYPEVIKDNIIDKKLLKDHISKNYDFNIAELERIVHPFVVNNARRFIFSQRLKLKKLVILDVPLLFESKMDKLCDYTIFLECDEDTIKKRVLDRHNISESTFYKMLNKQKIIKNKSELASFVINTNDNLEKVTKEVNQIIKKISNTKNNAK